MEQQPVEEERQEKEMEQQPVEEERQEKEQKQRRKEPETFHCFTVSEAVRTETVHFKEAAMIQHKLSDKINISID